MLLFNDRCYRAVVQILRYNDSLRRLQILNSPDAVNFRDVLYLVEGKHVSIAEWIAISGVAVHVLSLDG